MSASNGPGRNGHFIRTIHWCALAWLSLNLIPNCRVAAQGNPLDRPVLLVGKPYPQYRQVAAAFSEQWKESTGYEPAIVSFPKRESAKKQLLASNLDHLLMALARLRASEAANDPLPARQIKEGVQLAVKLADLLQRSAPRTLAS